MPILHILWKVIEWGFFSFTTWRLLKRGTPGQALNYRINKLNPEQIKKTIKYLDETFPEYVPKWEKNK